LLPDGVGRIDLDRFVARWNRSCDYWDSGILNLGDVPAGEDTDFIAIDMLMDAL